MWIALASIFLANASLVIGATWRLAGVIQKVITRLDGIKELMDLGNKHTEQRLTSMESQIAIQNQTILDIQKRQTSMELEMKMKGSG
jgi:hypothetical protein